MTVLDRVSGVRSGGFLQQISSTGARRTLRDTIQYESTLVTFQGRPYMLWASGLQGWTVPGMRRVRYYLTSYKLALPDITRVPPATNIALRRRLATEWKMCARDDSGVWSSHARTRMADLGGRWHLGRSGTLGDARGRSGTLGMARDGPGWVGWLGKS